MRVILPALRYGLVAVLVLAAGMVAAASGGGRRHPAAKPLQEAVLGERSLLNINNISIWFRRDGWSGRNPQTNNSGVTFPRSTGQVVYQDGLVWGGRVLDGGSQMVRVGGQTFSAGTVPGRILSRGVAENPADPSVRIYRVRRDYGRADLRLDASELYGKDLDEVDDGDVERLRAHYARDWREWPWRKGAPFLDRDGDGAYDPAVDEPSFRDVDCRRVPEQCSSPADQVAWFVVNDLDPGATTSLYGSAPIGLEVQTTLWGYARTDPLGDAVFRKFRVIYKGTAETPDDAVIEDMYFSQWSDPDLGDFGDDFAGCDVELSLGYSYNSADEDSHYEDFDLAPPAVGYDFLQGPIVPDDGGEAVFDFGRRPGYRNLPMTSFVYFAAGSAIDDPALGEYVGSLEWYNLVRGFQPQPDTRNPAPYTNPITGEVTFFALDGDPLSGAGWNDGVPLPPGDRRIVLNTGPFAMALGDTQEVVVSLLGGVSSDNLRSIAQLKYTDRLVQDAYDNFFAISPPPAAPRVRAHGGDGVVVLDWGYDFEAVRATEEGVQPPFRFEGYNLYQFPLAAADFSQALKTATYDLANGVTTIWGTQLDPASGEVVSLPRQKGTDSGLRWVARIERDALRRRSLFNGQPYYFAVTAYSHNPDPEALVSFVESVPQKIMVVPQLPRPGTRGGAELDEHIPVVQLKGHGDVDIFPVVVVPAALVGATYTITFNPDRSWNLRRDGRVVLANQRNYSLDDSYPAIDGVQVKVGDPVFEAPTTYRSAAVAVDADPHDGDLHLWGDGTLFGLPDGRASTFWEGGGSDDPMLLGRDLEFRFTGVWNEDRTAIVAAGSMATLAGIEPGSAQRDLDSHPFRPPGAPASGPFLQRIPFEVWDVEDPDRPRQLNVAFQDRGADGSRDAGSAAYHKTYNMAGRDYITVIATDYDSTQVHSFTDSHATWVLLFRQGGLSTWSRGDVLRIEYDSVIVAGEDEFQFTTTALIYSLAGAREDIERINVFPNPYYGVNPAETSRFAHFVTFSHLPRRATIRVFDLSGTLVRTLEKDDPDQFMPWDLNNDSGLPVASGFYLVHIAMPEIGKVKVLKLAIVREQQFLEYY